MATDNNDFDYGSLQDIAKQLESIIIIIKTTRIICPQCKTPGPITGIELGKIHFECNECQFGVDLER